MTAPTGLYVNAAATGTLVIDLALYTGALLTITGNTTITIANLPDVDNETRFILTTIDGGAFTVTHPVGIRWGGAGVVGTAPTLQISGTDKMVYDIYNNGSVVYDGSYTGRFA